jgi:hypothetical protein
VQTNIDAVSKPIAKLLQDSANATAVYSGQGKVIDSANAGTGLTVVTHKRHQ